MQIDIRPFSTLLFDMGGVIVDIDLERAYQAFQSVAGEHAIQKIQDDGVLQAYEIGDVTTGEFVARVQRVLDIQVEADVILECWNALLLGLHEERILWIKELAKTHRLLLLSNTNDTHFSRVNDLLAMEFETSMDVLFERLYLSHEIKLLKPDQAIFEYVLKDAGLEAKDVLFIEDTKENAVAAAELGFNTLVINRNEHFFKYLQV